MSDTKYIDFQVYVKKVEPVDGGESGYWLEGVDSEQILSELVNLLEPEQMLEAIDAEHWFAIDKYVQQRNHDDEEIDY